MSRTFSVVNNPSLSDSKRASSPRAIETGDALALLTDRQFHVAGDLILHSLPYVDPYAGGCFLTGKYATKRMTKLRPDHPSVPMVVEPAAIRNTYATEDAPFQISVDEDELFEPTLDFSLDLRRLDGGDLVMSPTGQIRAGDSAALKKALKMINELDRTDLLFTLPMQAGWLSVEHLTTQLIQVINRSRHPVALTFTDPTNPIASKKRLRAYRRVFEETTGTVLAYRTDLAGMDARAHGAIASAIGAYPSVRRLNPVGSGGRAIDPEDLSPHMLVGDMLRFVRSTHMRRVWFADADPFECLCGICRGEAIDRLHGPEDRTEGHLHNMLELGRLHATTLGLTPGDLLTSWKSKVRDAVDTYPQLATHIGAPVKMPVDLTFWAGL